MKRIVNLLLLAIAFFLAASVASAQTPAKSVKRHALAKVLMAPVKGVLAVPKVAFGTAKVGSKGIAYTLGGVLFAAESGVDVVHLATDVLDKGVQAEGWKRNVFHYPNIIAGKADTGLEAAYSFFFKVQI